MWFFTEKTDTTSLCFSHSRNHGQFLKWHIFLSISSAKGELKKLRPGQSGVLEKLVAVTDNCWRFPSMRNYKKRDPEGHSSGTKMKLLAKPEVSGGHGKALASTISLLGKLLGLK